MMKLHLTRSLSLGVLFATLLGGGCGVESATDPLAALEEAPAPAPVPPAPLPPTPPMPPPPEMLPPMPAPLQCSTTAKIALEAGPIWSGADAKGKCASTCGAKLRWTGGWWTTVPNKMSVCECEPLPPAAVEAGPIWNNADAKGKCPKVCGAEASWTGGWWTTVPNKMSVCECRTPSPAKAALEAGPIWNGADAKGKCATACTAAKREWTGGWWTTVPNQMSVCECGCQP